MDRHELEAALRELDRHLASPCHVLVVGGAAMVLHFGANRATRDVDAMLLRGNLSELRLAVAAVAREHNLPQDWMSDAVKGFAGILPPDYVDRLVPLDWSLERLSLFVLGRSDQIAMKIVALREQDLEDLELLLPGSSEADRQTLVAIVDHVASFRPDWAQKIRYFLLEQGWEID